ncbi:TonB-dependent receptor [Dysgonomonas sp. ZJ279]|uniref:TonB-dependent receptor n=1 Tax=Dysgonomonas sp. ZJ279 TaxID=2709796 RepID=UPI0013EA98F9|nr:TonB-dependent receptor [Dysgonomonas sp. ZJ279]
MKKIILLSFYIVCFLSISAQQPRASAIKGHVLDSQTEEHLPGVIVKIENTERAVMSDETGHFSLNNIPAGTYILTTQYLGYASSRLEVNIANNETKNVSLYIEPESQLLNEVSVEASARALNRKLSPVVVNQLTTKTFEATNSVSLSQGLNYMPGLRVETNCQNCGTQEVRINGLEGQYSQMLMDGQPIFSSLTQMYGLEQLPTNMIEQVEVIRGGGSVLYGSNAIGGVMNIITKEPEKNSYQVRYNLSMIDGKSADNTVFLNSSFVDRSKTSGISLFANMRSRDPWDANGDGFSEIGKNRASSIGLRSFVKPTLRDKITFEYHYISEYRRGGDNMDKPPHQAMIAETTDYYIHSGGAGYTHLSEDHKKKLSIHASLQDTRRTGYYGAGFDPNGYGKTYEIAATGTALYEINMDKLLFMPAKFTIGYTQEYTNLNDSIHSRDIKQIVNIGSLFAQNEWKDDNLTLILGIRADKHNMLHNINIIPRGSLRYKLTEKINLRAAYSMGYRAPQITASDLDVPIIGGSATITVLDKDLKREYSSSINGGADFTFYNDKIYSYFLVEGFYTKINRVFITEETGSDEQGNTIMTRKNGDGAYVYGVNMEATIQPVNWLEVQGGFTLQRSRYTVPISWSSEPTLPPVKEMLRSPDTYGFFTATATPKKSYAASLSGVYTGPMLTPHFAGAEGIMVDRTVRTPSFMDMTIKLSYFFNLNATNNLEINGGIQNMFDQRQKDFDKGPNRDSEYIYGPSLPRTFFIGLKLSSL